MTLFTLPPPSELNQTEAPTDLSGFERYYLLLRVLTNVQEPATFYERLRILLTLARWRGEPPTVQALGRVLSDSAEGLVQNLARLRAAGWLISGQDDQRYVLTPHGRLLLVLLQMLAQPWQEGDVTAVAAQLYEAGEGLELRRDLLSAQYESLLSALEEQVRQIESTQEAEDTTLVASRLAESRRNVKIAHKALELRQKGAVTPDDYDQVQRMHGAISRLSIASPRLEARYKKLLMRDLLAQGLVTLGDIMVWAREAELEELATSIRPYMKLPYLPLWATPEAALLDAGVELSGKTAKARRHHPPEPVPITSLPATAELDEIKQLVYRKQAELRSRLQTQDPLALSEWVAQAEWTLAVTHFAAALDPQLRQTEPSVYLNLNEEGQLESQVNEVIDQVTLGELSHLLKLVANLKPKSADSMEKQNE